jgi:hypothetical protein
MFLGQHMSSCCGCIMMQVADYSREIHEVYAFHIHLLLWYVTRPNKPILRFYPQLAEVLKYDGYHPPPRVALLRYIPHLIVSKPSKFVTIWKMSDVSEAKFEEEDWVLVAKPVCPPCVLCPVNTHVF